MRKLTTALICTSFLSPCLAQQTGLSFSGVITGTLSGDDGTPIVGGYVSLALVPPHFSRLRQTGWTVVSGAGGTFQFAGLNDGRYQVCAQAPKSAWLSPCEWGPQPAVISLSSAQPVADTKVTMKKGAAVGIRLDDPGRLLSQFEGKAPGAHLLIGVGNNSNTFLPALVTSRDATGREYQVVIPFNALVKIVVYSSFFQLTDTMGLSVPRARTVAIPVTVVAGQPSPTIRLNIAGGG